MTYLVTLTHALVNLWRALTGASLLVNQEYQAMTASFDRLSDLVDQAVAKLDTVTAPVVNGTPDADLDAVSDRLEAALNPAPAEPVAAASAGVPVQDATGAWVDSVTGQPTAAPVQ